MKKNLLKFFIGIVMALSSHYAQSQTRTITGVVVAQDDGLPIPGVSVGVKGTGMGTQTSAEGKYSLTAPAGATAITFSFIGYATAELPLTGSVINVKLIPANRQLTEVVVTGSGVATSK